MRRGRNSARRGCFGIVREGAVYVEMSTTVTRSSSKKASGRYVTIVALTRTNPLPRLFVPGTFISYRRRHETVHHKCALVKIEGVNCAEDTKFYHGKRVVYVYKAFKPQLTKNGSTSRLRVISGKVCRSHGNNGVVRCNFKHNLPCEALGKKVRVFLYPSRV